ncbi:MAG: hypothetical protein Q7S92_06400 [Candidatus Diapherotrites archaeon]|nr:hypothetical protein [Candidatus Diapherotrites archaeon]
MKFKSIHAILGIALILLIISGCTQQTNTDTTASTTDQDNSPDQSKGMIAFQSNPNSTVTIQGMSQQFGTPGVIELEPGTYELTFTQGEYTETRTAVVTAGESITVNVAFPNSENRNNNPRTETDLVTPPQDQESTIQLTSWRDIKNYSEEMDCDSIAQKVDTAIEATCGETFQGTATDNDPSFLGSKACGSSEVVYPVMAGDARSSVSKNYLDVVKLTSEEAVSSLLEKIKTNSKEFYTYYTLELLEETTTPILTNVFTIKEKQTAYRNPKIIFASQGLYVVSIMTPTGGDNCIFNVQTTEVNNEKLNQFTENLLNELNQ